MKKYIIMVKYTHKNNFMWGENMKQHRFWAWAAVFCMFMVMITGYKHK